VVLKEDGTILWTLLERRRRRRMVSDDILVNDEPIVAHGKASIGNLLVSIVVTCGLEIDVVRLPGEGR